MDEKNVESLVICLKKLSLNINRFVFCLKALSQSLESLHVNSYRELTELEYLDVDVSLPEYVCRMQNLKRLRLSPCRETEIPNQIGSMHNLTELTVDKRPEYEILHLHYIFQLTGLERLSIMNAPVYNLPDNMSKMSKLKTLSIKNSCFIFRLENIGRFPCLEVLDLSGTRAGTLPENIGNLCTLEVLDLSNTNIKELPDSIGNLCNLKILNLSNTNISELPDSIGNLCRLEVLDLSNSRIGELPDSIGNLVHLKKLSAGDSSLITLPNSIGNLHCLEVLDLSNSQIRTLPSGIRNLNRLSILLLNNTPVRWIPASISRLPLLETIDIENCYNIETIPWHLEEKGVDINLFLDNYYERRYHFFSFDDKYKDTLSDPIDSVRIIVFGKQGAGKTLLLKRLCSEHDSHSCETAPSSDLDIYRHSFNMHGRDVEFNFWEIGSSEESYALHPLYIDNSIFFIVVIEDGSFDDIIAQAKFWIERIYVCERRYHLYSPPFVHAMLLVNCREGDSEGNRPDEKRLQHENSHIDIKVHVAYLSVADANDVEFEQYFVQKLLKMTDSVFKLSISDKLKQTLREYCKLSDKGVPYIQTTSLRAYGKCLDGSSYLTLSRYHRMHDKPICAVQPSRLLQAIHILFTREVSCDNQKRNSVFLTEDQFFDLLQKANYFTDTSQAKSECQWIIEMLIDLSILGEKRGGLFAPVLHSAADSIPFPNSEQPHLIYELDFKYLPFNLLIPMSPL